MKIFLKTKIFTQSLTCNINVYRNKNFPEEFFLRIVLFVRYYNVLREKHRGSSNLSGNIHHVGGSVFFISM